MEGTWANLTEYKHNYITGEKILLQFLSNLIIFYIMFKVL